MKRADYDALEEAASNWSRLRQDGLRVFGVGPGYYLGFFAVSFFISIISLDDESIDSFISFFLIMMGIGASYLTYVFYPHFVSRRDRNGLSGYEFFSKRLGAAAAVLILAFIFVYARDGAENNDIDLDQNYAVESLSVEKGQTERDDITANIVKEKFPEDENPVEFAPAAPSLDSAFELKELPETSVSLEITPVVVDSVEETTDTVEVAEKPKKRWRLFRKRKVEED